MKSKIDIIARTVHESIRAYQTYLGEAVAPPWEISGWMMQEATLEGVELAIRNPSPGASHELWMQSLIRGGWVYGPEKDAEKKTHPSLIPFEQLSETEKTKDAIVVAISRSLAAVLGVEVLY